MSNNVDPDEMAHKPSRLDLRCLQKLLPAMAVKELNQKALLQTPSSISMHKLIEC